MHSNKITYYKVFRTLSLISNYDVIFYNFKKESLTLINKSSFGGYLTAWHEAGSGGQKIVLLHCSLAHGGAWKGVMKLLSPDFKLYAPDLPGQGQSQDWDQKILFQDQSVIATVGLLNEIGEPCHLIGHSFGATVAMRIALEFPELVKSLILFEPVFFGCLQDAKNPMYEEWSVREKPYTDLVERGDFEGASKAFMELWGTGAKWENLPSSQRSYIKDRIHLIAASSRSIITPGKNRMRLSDYEKVAKPVYLLEGENSPPVISEVQKTLEHTFPNALSNIIGNSGHMAPITHPKEFSDEVRRFLTLNY